MEKRYQIFISSTFTDLKDERQAVLKAILEIDHMPAGMELFPAIDDTAWQLITDVIDSSDYYVLVVGGRYGSLDETGIGFTEKEYDFAIKSKKPVVPLLHINPDNLPREKTETDSAAWEKLKVFRAKVEKKHTCVYWSNADDLKAKVIIGLTAVMKRHPAVGWVRADSVPTGATLVEVLTLKNRIAELESAAAQSASEPPPGTESLAQGNDRFEIGVSFVARPYNSTYPHREDTKYKASIRPTWNAIFAAVAPSMISESSELALRSAFRKFLEKEVNAAFEGKKTFKNYQLRDHSVSSEDIDTCIVQLRALGLISESDKKRSVKDSGTYWTLTPYGNLQMVQLRAVHREPVVDEVEAGDATESEDDVGS